MENQDVHGRWRQEYFAVTVRDFLRDGSSWGSGERARYTSRETQQHSLERELAHAVRVIYDDIAYQRPSLLQVREQFQVLAADELIPLDPPHGRLTSVFEELVSLEDTSHTIGHREIPFIPVQQFFMFSHIRWTTEGRSIRVCFSGNRASGADRTLEMCYVPTPVPIVIDASDPASKSPYMGLHPRWHYAVALKATTALMSVEDPNWGKFNGMYQQERSRCLAAEASHVTDPNDFRPSHYDLTAFAR